MVAKSGKKAHAYLHRASVNNYLGLLLIGSGVARGGATGAMAPPPPKLLVVNFPIIEYKFISYTILHTCIQFNIRLYKKEDKENNNKNKQKRDKQN